MSHRDSGDADESTAPAETASTDEKSDRDDRGVRFSRRDYLKAASAATATAAAAAGVGSAATTRYGITFDRVVDAVDDLGADPNGNTSVRSLIANNATDGTLIQFPDGEFLLDRSFTISGGRNIGIVGSGNTRFVAPGGTKVAIVYKNVTNGLFADLTLDQTRTRADFVTKFFTDDYTHIENVDVVGYNQLMGGDTKVGFKIVPQASAGDATIVVKNFSAVDGGSLGDYIGGGGGMYLGPGHRGTARIVDCHLEEWPNNGIYAGRANGPVQVEGGTFRNSDVSQVRLSGPNSYVRGATVEVDMSKSDNPGSPRNQRGVLIETGRIQKTGGGVYDCDIRMADSPSAGNAILVHGNAGAAKILNTRIVAEKDGMMALRAVQPQATNGGKRPPAPLPHHVRMDNVTITGSAANSRTISITDRPGSEVTNCCITQTGSNRNGVRLVDCADATVADSTIDVTGQATNFVRSNVSTSNVSTDGTCTTSDGGTDDTTSGGSDDGSTDGDATPDYKQLVVEPGDSTEEVQYELTVDGELVATETVDGHEEIDGNTVTGIMYDGVDGYQFTGSLTDVTADGEIEVLVDGQTVDLTQFEEPTTKTLTVEPADGTDERVNYSFSVDGTVTAGESVDAHEEISDGSVSGIMYYGIDEFEITGSLTDFQADGPLSVSIDGQAVDLSQFDPEPTTKTLTVEPTDGTDERVNYSFAVDGSVTAGESVDAHEEINDGSVSGIMYYGIDEFEITGSLTDFQADGPLSVSIDGQAVDLSQFDPEPLPNTLVIDGSNTDSDSTYTFSVTGDVAKDPELGSINENDTIDDGSVSGIVENGVDGYRFDGDIVAFDIDGTARVRFEDNDG